MIKEHDRIVLKSDVATADLKAGDVGTVVHIHKNGEAFEVEFLTLSGETFAIETVPKTHVRPITKLDIAHSRTRAHAPR